MTIDEYILGHIDAEGDYLHALWRDTQLRLSYGQMASGHLQGRLLKMLIEMTKPLKVLELGTYSGYATLCMAEGLPDGAELHTFEVFDENEDFLRQWIGGSPYADRIHLHIGDALQLLPPMGGEWDFAYIDADKREYCAYLDLVYPLVPVGGFILADNTLWDGHIIDPAYDKDKQTLGLRAFNDRLAADDRFEQVILPLRDGLTIIRKVK